jgi:hypothetical protein
MVMPRADVHDDVPSRLPLRDSRLNSGVCRCGAVFDRGNVAVPLEFQGMCGRCAAARGFRISGATARLS